MARVYELAGGATIGPRAALEFRRETPEPARIRRSGPAPDPPRRIPVTIARVLAVSLVATSCLVAFPPAASPRARDLGVPFDGTPGAHNAITDVAGVEVGHTTVIRGDGKLMVGEGPVRTGVTVIFPLGKTAVEGVTAGYFVLNGTGEMTGAIQMDEHGLLYGPLALTNTLSVGAVGQAVVEWSMKHVADEMDMYARTIPTVAETWDGPLNDIYGFHVKPEHVFAALDAASGGPVAEGNVGGGTGMVVYGLKGGVGTASRVVSKEAGGWTVGVLVQANHGTLEQLTVAGVPVGRSLAEERGRKASVRPAATPIHGRQGAGSIIIVVATDAPLAPTHVKRIARRAALGLARTGSTAHNGSGDIIVGFSTRNRARPTGSALTTWEVVPDEQFDPLFDATVQATEEAVINALVAAKTMTGANGVTVEALPHDRLRELLRRHGRLAD
jgi:L-aminopeptidase/D-esterase-like protein